MSLRQMQYARISAVHATTFAMDMQMDFDLVPRKESWWDRTTCRPGFKHSQISMEVLSE